MKTDKIIKNARKLSRHFRVNKGKNFRLKDCDPGDTLDFTEEDKPRAKEALTTGIEALAGLQDKLYAQDQWAVLLIFQAMDAAGKDGAIKHVMSGINPQGCQVHSFKAPTSEELDHDYLWRCQRNLPERGRIGIFNRSYYEETLVVRVHPELLEHQKLPPGKRGREFWETRYEDINAFERHLVRNGTLILKFFLNVSKKEQKKRFMERLTNPEKHWKFSAADLAERGHWKDYMEAFEDTLSATSTKWAPWHVIPADHKWIARAIVSEVIVREIRALGLRPPQVPPERLKELAAARKKLEAE